MKHLSLILTLAAFLGAGLQPASAILIMESIETTPVAAANQDDPAFMTSITADGITYGLLTAGASVTPEAGDGGRLWGQGAGATDPLTVSNALTDLDITTGALNIGNDSLYFLGRSVTASSVLFLTGNSNSAGAFFAIDEFGNDISLSLAVPNATGSVASVAVRTVSGTELDRDIYGWVFEASEFTLTGGATVDDIAGFRVNSSNFDPMDFGLAAVAIPEPASATLLLGALGLALRRRLLQYKN